MYIIIVWKLEYYLFCVGDRHGLNSIQLILIFIHSNYLSSITYYDNVQDSKYCHSESFMKHYIKQPVMTKSS